MKTISPARFGKTKSNLIPANCLTPGTNPDAQPAKGAAKQHPGRRRTPPEKQARRQVHPTAAQAYWLSGDIHSAQLDWTQIEAFAKGLARNAS